VDEVTQWQVVGATAYISEAWLIPVLKAMQRQFPFQILGFHSDNGSEFINHAVAWMLNKLLVEQTKSRPRQSNDNGLVEAKNGAMIRKHMGYGHIESRHAEAIEEFYEQHLNPYLNYHRPCGVPEVVTDGKGKTEEGVSVVRNVVGGPAAVAGSGSASARRHDAGRPGETAEGGKRHERGAEDARSETELIYCNSTEEDGVKRRRWK